MDGTSVRRIKIAKVTVVNWTKYKKKIKTQRNARHKGANTLPILYRFCCWIRGEHCMYDEYGGCAVCDEDGIHGAVLSICNAIINFLITNFMHNLNKYNISFQMVQNRIKTLLLPRYT